MVRALVMVNNEDLLEREMVFAQPLRQEMGGFVPAVALWATAGEDFGSYAGSQQNSDWFCVQPDLDGFGEASRGPSENRPNRI